MEITITIPDAKLNEFKTGFLAQLPIPQIPIEEGSEGMKDAYTELQWFKKHLIEYAILEYRRGKTKLAREAALIDTNILG